MKKQDIYNTLQEHIQSMDIEDFLIEDADHFLTTLNYYKMKNIYRNKEKFLEYLRSLHHSYCKHFDINNDGHVSIDSEQVEEKNSPSLGSVCMNVDVDPCTENKKVQAISAVRGYFLFTAMEFALGTPLRLKLRDRLRKEEGILEDE